MKHFSPLSNVLPEKGIRDTMLRKLHGPLSYPFSDKMGYEGKCLLRIYANDHQAVVIASQSPLDMPPSIDHNIEEIVNKAVKHFEIDSHKLVWIEHLLPEPNSFGQEEFAVVKFDILTDGKLGNPKWRWTKIDEVKEIIGQQID